MAGIHFHLNISVSLCFENAVVRFWTYVATFQASVQVHYTEHWMDCIHVHTYVRTCIPFCILWFVVQVASVLSELLENVLMNDTAPSLALASLIPSMLMVEWSTEAVQHLFKQFVQDCATTIATPVSVYQNTFSNCVAHLFCYDAKVPWIISTLFLKFGNGSSSHVWRPNIVCLLLLLGRSKLLLSAHHCVPCFKWTCCHSSYWWTTVSPWTGFLSHSR